MIGITFTIEGERQLLVKLERLSPAIEEASRKAVAASSIHLASYIKENLLSGQVLGNRTGNLRRAVGARPETGEVVVDRTARYGRFHEYGVDHPWTITPSRKSVLRFTVGGDVVFAKRVTHLGLKERSFMRRGLREDQPAIKRIFRRYVAAAVKGEDQAE
jgi:hypothetical protein